AGKGPFSVRPGVSRPGKALARMARRRERPGLRETLTARGGRRLHVTSPADMTPDHALVATGVPMAIGFTSSRPATNPPMCAMYATPPDSAVFAIDPIPLIN